MTVRECITIVDSMKPNQFGDVEKIRWLDQLDRSIYINIIQTHEMKPGEVETMFGGYTEDNMDAVLLAQPPHDVLYEAYLKMKIDEENGETARYNNSVEIYNLHYGEYAKWYNRTHMPVGTQLRIF